MDKVAHKLQRYASTISVLTLCFLPGVHQAMAAPGTISQIPLYVGPSVEPNVLFLADDSGSMGWSLMTPEGDGIMNLSSNDYYYSQPADCGSSCDWPYTVPSEEYLTSKGWSTLGAWRAWNYNYNKLYYNPTLTYIPWAGVDSAGVAYGNASPTAARLNPYSTTGTTVSLINKDTQYTSDYPGKSSFTVTKFYPARYYTWTDSNNNGVVDASDAHTLVEIANAATYQHSTAQSVYVGGPNRTDCAAKPNCTYAEEIKNFANWYSYYRTRELATKAAISLSAKDLTGVRVGFATINNNNSVGIKVASMNLSPATGNKKKLYDKVFKFTPNGGTPLQTELRDAGKYFECVSGNILGASGSSCPILPLAQGGQCQKNFTILMTDGFYNGDSPSLSPSNTDGDHNTTFDGAPYGDTYKNTLADVAMNYYERDLATSLPNDVPVWNDSADQATHQHMNTFTVAFGVDGTLDPKGTKTPGVASDTDPTASGFSWPNPDSGDAQKIDDLWHAAYNGRGQFYSAQDPNALTAGLADAFASVTRGTSSSSAVAFNTSSLELNGRIYQATFNPSDNWYGDLVAYDVDTHGVISDTAHWHASDVLDATPPANRMILTYNDTTKSGIAFKTLSALSTKQKNDLKTTPSGTVDTDANAQARIDYIRGDRSKEADGTFRERTNVLGDIVYSSPIYVGKPQADYSDTSDFGNGNFSSFKSSHANRQGIIYVGANDGMLHGFSVADGSEVLAYIPNMLFSNASQEGLHYLTDPAYGHRYYVDMAPVVNDVYLNGAWHTILVGGYRAGARGLFALDVTDPSTFSESNANKIALWEFTSNDNSSMGYSYSTPIIAPMENGKWAVIFGNGYNNSGDGQAKLFILYLEGGMDGTWSTSDYKVITTGVGSSTDINGLSTPVAIDYNGNGKADRVYAGDIKGNLWAFDLSDATSDSNWKLDYGKPLFQAKIGSTLQPITSKPVVARNPSVAATGSNKPDLLVFFGTGQYLVNGDKSSTDQQTFYGVWDNKGMITGLGTASLTRSNLVAQTLTSSTTTLRIPSDNAVNYTSKYGWYFDLPTSGERVTVDPKIRGDYVFFNTLIPDPNTCNSKGYGWIMALKLANGGRADNPVFDINDDGEVDDLDKDSSTGFNPGGYKFNGIPSESMFIDSSEDGETYQFTVNDEGQGDSGLVKPGGNLPNGRLSWREIRQQ